MPQSQPSLSIKTSLYAKIFILFQYLLPQLFLTRLAGWVADRRWVWLKNLLISAFVRRFKVDLSSAASDKLDDYPTFNAFFVRPLKPSARPLPLEEDVLVSPVDGSISQLGLIKKDSLLQAKGSLYSLNALLGKEPENISLFEDGQFATFYLSPKDYHRVHIPFEGKLRQTTYVPGTLFSVNPLAAAKIPGLFARNERLVCLFDTKAGPMAVILIGAMIVGKIQTVWGQIERSNTLVTRDYALGPEIHLAKGAELGRFLMGSSVIILFAKDKIQWLPGLKNEEEVQMGQVLGVLT